MGHLIAIVGVLLLGLAMAATVPGVKDALVRATRALPSSTVAVTSSIIDSGTTPNGAHLTNVEYLLTAPAVTTAQLPDTKTFTYAIIHSDNADGSSPAVLVSNAIVQTGASAAGAAGNTYRFKPPSNAKRYFGFTVTPSGSGTGDASAATATLEGVF